MKKKSPGNSELITLLRNPRSGNTLLTASGTKKVLMIFDAAEAGQLDFVFQFTAPGASLELLMICFGYARHNFSINLRVEHVAPRTRSNIAFRAVLFEKSSVDFRGNVSVPQTASKSETFLRCDSVLLSPQARAKTIPCLEIVANDVKAGHAASVGRLDEEKLFYLQTRGLSMAEAQTLLLKSFITDSMKVFT